MCRRQPFELLAIPRQDLGAPCFDGLGYDEGIHGGRGTGRPEELSRDAPMAFVSSGHGADCLQDAVDGVSRGPPRTALARTTTGISIEAPNSRARARNARARWSPRLTASKDPCSEEACFWALDLWILRPRLSFGNLRPTRRNPKEIRDA